MNVTPKGIAALLIVASIASLIFAMVNLYTNQEACVGAMWSIVGPALATAFFSAGYVGLD